MIYYNLTFKSLVMYVSSRDRFGSVFFPFFCYLFQKYRITSIDPCKNHINRLIEWLTR